MVSVMSMLLEIILSMIIGLAAYYILRKRGLLPRVPKLDSNNDATSIQLAKLEERLKAIEGLDEKVAKKMENNILSWIEEETDPSFLAWYLECLLQAGLSNDHPIFESTIKRILEKQRRDGSWFTMDGERFSVAATLNVLKVLRMLNRIETI